MPQTEPMVASTAATGSDIGLLDRSDSPTIPQTSTWQCGSCNHRYPIGVRCPGCVTCDRCGDPVPAEQTRTTVTGSTICDDCLARFYWQCGQCDGWNPDGDGCANDCCDPDDCDCDNCRDDGYDGYDLVRSWDYRPRPVFHGDGRLFLGPEIEIHTPSYRQDECAQLAANHLGDLGYLKEDSSIGGGFEIVTHPMSYEWAKANFPWRMLTDLAEAGCDTSDQTGLHVHVSRAGFSSPGHAYRWMKLIYRNEVQVTRLARRSCPQYAAFTTGDRQLAKEYAKGVRADSRYRAINTCNRDTFELRVFASSLDPRQVKAVLGFAAASVEYTRTLRAHDVVSEGGWEWRSFVAWLRRQPVYQPLVDQLEVLSCAC